MHLSILAVSTLIAGIASAQSLAGLPTCATGCVTSLIPSECGLDPDCICHAESFLDAIACCVFQACASTSDQQAALDYAHGVCDPVGASTLLPASAGCSSTASAGNGTAIATSGSATVTLTSTPSGSGSGTVTSTSTPTSSGVLSSSGSESNTAATATGASATATPSASATPGAGSRLGVGLGVMGAGFLGLAALL